MCVYIYVYVYVYVYLYVYVYIETYDRFVHVYTLAVTPDWSTPRGASNDL